MKKFLLFICALFIVNSLIAQSWCVPKATFRNKDLEKMKKETLYVLNGYDKEFDEVVKYAVDKYWKLTPVKYINANDIEPLKKDKTCKMYLGIGGYAMLNYGRKFKHNELDLRVNSGFWSICYKMQFDNLSKPSDEFIGADKDLHLISNKIILNIMMMCAEMKKVEELGDAYSDYTLKDKLSSFTVYIPKETIENGLTEDMFKKYITKAEVKTSDELKKMVVDQTDVENKAQLFITRAGDNTMLYITNMKTGELIAYAYQGERGSASVGKKIDEDDLQVLFKRLQ